MAEASDLSRTEPASPQRLRQAREAGDVPRSAEFSAWLVLLAALAVLGWQAPRLLAALQSVTAAAFSTAAQPFSPLFLGALEATLWTLLPLFAAVFAAALVAPLLLSGWTYAPQVARADLARANPWRPLLRLFSADAWVDALLALVKWAAAALAVGWALATGWSALGTLADGAAGAALATTAAWIGRGLLALAAALVLAAALDAGWRWWRYLRRHAMTWQEVLAEARESEVSPELRARLHGRRQAAGQGAGDAATPHPNPLPLAGEGANAGPKAGLTPTLSQGERERTLGPRRLTR